MPETSAFRREGMSSIAPAAGGFTFNELLNGYEKLLNLQKFAIPTPTDPYVPDRELLAETWIIEFTLGNRITAK